MNQGCNSYLQIDNYQIDRNKILGTGGFASVYLGYYAKGKSNSSEEMNQLFAIKEISINNEFEITNSLIREINMLRHLKNRHIIQFIDAKKTENHFYLIMEYCSEGTLEDLVRHKQLNEDQILTYFNQIVYALKYLYSKKIFHRDIKPKNILLHNGEIKLVDFGLSKIIADQNINITQGFNTCVGTPQFMAPEMLKGIGWQEKSDIWSLGSTLYYMIFKELPWDQYSTSSMAILEQIERIFGIPQASAAGVSPPTQPVSSSPQINKQGEQQQILEKQISQEPSLQENNSNERNDPQNQNDKKVSQNENQITQQDMQRSMLEASIKNQKNTIKNPHGSLDLLKDQKSNKKKVYDQIDEKLKYLLPKDKNNSESIQVSEKTLRLLDSMLQVDIEKRIGWEELFSIPSIHEFLNHYHKKDEKALQKKKSIEELTPESLIVTQDESGENQEELKKYGEQWNHQIDELNKQKELSQKAKRRIEFELQKAKFLDQVSILLKEQSQKYPSLIPKDIYLKCQFLLIKRACIILSDLHRMIAFEVNSYGSVYIEEELWKSFLCNKDTSLQEKIMKENTNSDKKFSYYHNELDRAYKQLENFEYFQREDAYMQVFEENPCLIQEFNDNFLKLFQMLAEKAINLRTEEKIIGKKNDEILEQYKINIILIYYLMIILSFKNVFNDSEINITEFYQNCNQVGWSELLSRIEQAYNMWSPMKYS
ncbi:kinase domain protein (macronuclear) [Tetrahymena thermophila SB210]|uniref:Kinase domain protein n=1 Tax=Tetrahymena thermophila (strain SB210) TaxID=312017 RepID=W7XJV2_TETTS|nr:kinase domain protein [Tetrahymena thermophila SB210]EWS75971.1 kinase domain protein [Tetrahymena thermophila SB210]|eukprot:XP_012651489.1 kinase domain protein [Tetrahymena thermophila SB210]